MNNIKGDVFGGVTAAVVALPLALAFGVASGAGPLAGLYGAIFVGFFAALFGGTQTQISGPTGPMTVVMAAIIAEFSLASPEQGLALGFTVVVLAGLIQICMGVARLGKYITLVSYPVVSGFMSGIGVIIITIQLAPLLGHASSANTVASLMALPGVLAQPEMSAVIIGALTLAVLFFWPSVWARYMPPPLAALFIGTIALLLLFPDSPISRIGEVPAGLPSLQFPTFDLALMSVVLTKAVMLAGLGSIDSLLTSLVADNMTRTRHNSDKELIGQGIGNAVAGLFGGLPGAGATMRTVINIKAGGETHKSGMIHATILAVIVLGAGPLVEDIPHAVLAGILIKVGFDIIDWQFLRRINKLPLFSVCLMLGVLVMTVFVDLLTAVVIGVFVTNMVTIDRLTKLQTKGFLYSDGTISNPRIGIVKENEILSACDGEILLIKFRGPLSFGVAHLIPTQVAEYTKHKSVIMDFEEADVVGITSSLAIETIIKEELQAGRQVYLSGLHAENKDKLAQLGVLGLVDGEHTSANAIEAIDLVKKDLGIA